MSNEERLTHLRALRLELGLMLKLMEQLIFQTKRLDLLNSERLVKQCRTHAEEVLKSVEETIRLAGAAGEGDSHE